MAFPCGFPALHKSQQLTADHHGTMASCVGVIRTQQQIPHSLKRVLVWHVSLMEERHPHAISHPDTTCCPSLLCVDVNRWAAAIRTVIIRRSQRDR